MGNSMLHASPTLMNFCFPTLVDKLLSFSLDNIFSSTEPHKGYHICPRRCNTCDKHYLSRGEPLRATEKIMKLCVTVCTTISKSSNTTLVCVLLSPPEPSLFFFFLMCTNQFNLSSREERKETQQLVFAWEVAAL